MEGEEERLWYRHRSGLPHQHYQRGLWQESWPIHKDNLCFNIQRSGGKGGCSGLAVDNNRFLSFGHGR
jgi:hypothetical protein